jgi:hypothetical protein
LRRFLFKKSGTKELRLRSQKEKSASALPSVFEIKANKPETNEGPNGQVYKCILGASLQVKK